MVTMPASPACDVIVLKSSSSARVPFSVASATAWAPFWSSATTAQSPSITQPPVPSVPASGPQSRSLLRPASASSASLTWTTTMTSGLSPPVSTAAMANRSPSHGSTSLA